MKISWKRNEQIVRHTHVSPSVVTSQVKSIWSLYHNYSIIHENQWNPFFAGMFFFQHFAPMVPRFGCNCSSFFINYCKENNPKFDSPEEFRLWGIDLHNTVNVKLSSEQPDNYYPQISLEEYNYLWNNTPPRKSSRLVITVATGKYKKILSYSRNSFQAYATKHGADYIELTNELPTKDLLSDCPDDIDYNSSWHLNKIRVGSMAAQYDQTLFVDVDCIITDKCRDLFQYPGTAIVDDWSVLTNKHSTLWIHPEVSMVAKSQGLEPPDYWERCLNTGVVLCSRESNPWVMPKYKLPHNHCGEQFWVDLNIDDFVSLPETCNWQWWRGSDFWRGLPDAEVIHLAGCPSQERLELIKWAAKEYGLK